jgi:PadR family transcriptional regulator PadR
MSPHRGEGRGTGRGRGPGGGRGLGRGRGGRRGRVIGFLQPCLLGLLASGDAHGYGLLQGLDRFGFESDDLDPSLVYRALRDMEEQGLVRSKWEEESLGPQRRVYGLTGDGQDALTIWIQDLERTQKDIAHLLTALKQNAR